MRWVRREYVYANSGEHYFTRKLHKLNDLSDGGGGGGGSTAWKRKALQADGSSANQSEEFETFRKLGHSSIIITLEIFHQQRFN